jgi:hypothetical protein
MMDLPDNMETQQMRRLAGAVLFILAASLPSFGATDGQKAEEIMKKEWPVKVTGVIPAIKFTDKDFEDLGLVWWDKPRLEHNDNFFCAVAYPGKGFDVLETPKGDFEGLTPQRKHIDRSSARLQIAVTRCTNAHNAQRYSIIYSNRGDEPDPLSPVNKGPLADVGDVCYFKPSADINAPGGESRYAVVQFARNNVSVNLYANAGNIDQKFLEEVAHRIDKALAGWVVDPKKMPKPAAVEGAVAALDFTAKDFEGLGQAEIFKTGKPVADLFSANVTRPGRRHKPDISVEIQRYPTTAEALKTMTPAAKPGEASGMTLPDDEADAVRLGDLGDARTAAHELVSAAFVSTSIFQLSFVRNNVVVHLRYGGASYDTPDLESLARQIDKHLLGLIRAENAKEAKSPK